MINYKTLDITRFEHIEIKSTINLIINNQIIISNMIDENRTIEEIIKQEDKIHNNIINYFNKIIEQRENSNKYSNKINLDEINLDETNLDNKDFIEIDLDKFEIDINPYSLTEEHEKLYKIYYEREEDLLNNSLNYSNELFCCYCRNHEVLPEHEILNFLNEHIFQNPNINKQYLILVFRLKPELFYNLSILNNKHLKKYILSYLNIDIKDLNNEINLLNENEQKIKYTEILNLYYKKIENCVNMYLFKILFHQSNLKYNDYVKCDSCKNYLCPKHRYLSNIYYAKCKCCMHKNWIICGWCKPGFNEFYACKFLHKINDKN